MPTQTASYELAVMWPRNMTVSELLLMTPYAAALYCVASSYFKFVRQVHVSAPLSSVWWPLRWGYGVLVIHKSLLTQQGLELHSQVVRRCWWSVRFLVLGLLMNIAYFAL